jgi:hypothetical protein
MSERLPRFTNQTHTHTGRCGRTWIPCDSIRSADLGTCQLLPRQKTLLTNEHSFRCNPFRRTRYVRRSICLFALTEVRETDRWTKCQCQVVLRSGRELIADLYIDRLAHGHEHHLVRTPTRKSPSKRGGSRSQCHMRCEGARGAARSHVVAHGHGEGSGTCTPCPRRASRHHPDAENAGDRLRDRTAVLMRAASLMPIDLDALQRRQVSPVLRIIHSFFFCCCN